MGQYVTLAHISRELCDLAHHDEEDYEVNYGYAYKWINEVEG